MESPDPRSADPKIAEAFALLQAAEQAAASGQPQGFAQAAQLFERGIARLGNPAQLTGEPLRWMALAWIGRGNVLRMLGPGAAQAEALRSYDQAIAVLSAGILPSVEDDQIRLNDLANAWTQRGISIMGAWPADKLPEAVRSFDEAIAARRTLPPGPNQEYTYGLASGWMNRADALTRIGGQENLAAGLQAYDEAIALMRTLPIDQEDGFRHRLAVACMNRGITRQAQGDADALAESVRGFDDCIELLREHPLREHPEGAHLLACAWLNRAGSGFITGSTLTLADTQAAAREAIALVKTFEPEQPQLAEIGLKGRHALCRALSATLAENDAQNQFSPDTLGEATDTVDEALALARTWESRGIPAFRPLSLELFRFGAMLYQKYQPQFLADFALENVDPETGGALLTSTPEAARLAGEAIWNTLQDFQRRSFAAVGKPGVERMLETLGALRGADERIRQLLTRR